LKSQGKKGLKGNLKTVPRGESQFVIEERGPFRRDTPQRSRNQVCKRPTSKRNGRRRHVGGGGRGGRTEGPGKGGRPKKTGKGNCVRVKKEKKESWLEKLPLKEGKPKQDGGFHAKRRRSPGGGWGSKGEWHQG